jgi:hypothetical protein
MTKETRNQVKNMKDKERSGKIKEKLKLKW